MALVPENDGETGHKARFRRAGTREIRNETYHGPAYETGWLPPRMPYAVCRLPFALEHSTRP